MTITRLMIIIFKKSTDIFRKVREESEITNEIF